MLHSKLHTSFVFIALLTQITGTNCCNTWFKKRWCTSLKIGNAIGKFVDSHHPDIENLSSADITFLVYKPEGPTETLDIDTAQNLINSSLPTKIIVHGWVDHPRKPWIIHMAHNYHLSGNYNVLAVNWSLYSHSSYYTSAATTQSVGSIIGEKLLKINTQIENFLRNIHLIGHSLGGHVAGFAGKQVAEVQKVDRISGLDVAGPLFELPFTEKSHCRLSKHDAGFVDLIHTEMVTRGVWGAYGHVDFYVNNGIAQMNCDEYDSITDFVSCGHQTVHEYFSRTILKPKAYEGVACDSYYHFIDNKCDDNKTAFMGEGVDHSTRGTFYVSIDNIGRDTRPEIITPRNF